MSRSVRPTAIKFTAFAVVMVVLTGFLYLVFAQYRAGSTTGYSAVFTNASQLKSGDTVRVAGVRVGTVDDVSFLPDRKVLVEFDADPNVVLTTGTQAAIRYLNLVGDRYLELIDGPGPVQTLPAGSRIPIGRTEPALDLDLLLGGLKPVVQGLNPQDVNAFTSSLIQVLQGQGGTLQDLMSKTSSFSTALADNNQVVEQLIDSLDTTLATISKDGDKFSGTVDRLQRLVSELATDRDPIGAAIDSLSNGTASLAQLLGDIRSPLKGTMDQLNRLAPLLDQDKELIDVALQKAPANYRKVVRPGSYGAFINYYICGIRIRTSDLQGRTAVFPWIEQTNGRCAEPNA